MQETVLLESKDLRDQAINRIDVLEKVKKLFLIPEMEVMTIRQVAEYYEVETDTLRKCYQLNQNEIDSDGASIKSYKDFLMGKDFTLESKSKGKVTVRVNDSITLEIPNRGIRVFPQRAILRIGMLLRDSEVAKEVRTQLLNTFDHSTDEQRTASINEELDRLYSKVDSLESKVDQMIDNTTINSRQAQKLNRAARERINNLLGGAHSPKYKEMSKIYFANLWNNFDDRFDVSTYKDLNPIHMSGAMDFITHWSYID